MGFSATVIHYFLKNLFTSALPRIAAQLRQQSSPQAGSPWRSVLLMLVLTFGLTGCLDAQTTIQVSSPHRGQIVQHIQLGSQLTAAQGWLDQLANQARKLDGKVDRPSRQELSVTVPFTNARDLETKFNQLVSPPKGSSDLPEIKAHLAVRTSNLLLLQRDRLVYDVDLSALGLPTDSAGLLNPGQGLDISFGVAGPWGAGGRASEKQAGTATWRLQPGQPNHVEASLWMPNPIGLGAAAIVGLVVAGNYYNRKQA